MPDFKILSVSQQDGCLIVQGEHYHLDGSLWFVENYLFQGREGLKHKRVTDEQGHLLMGNGDRAPTRIVNKEMQQYLPPGSTWMRRSEPHLDEVGIVGVMRSIHNQRLSEGWPHMVDVLSTCTAQGVDINGIDSLFLAHQGLAGRVYDR